VPRAGPPTLAAKMAAKREGIILRAGPAAGAERPRLCSPSSKIGTGRGPALGVQAGHPARRGGVGRKGGGRGGAGDGWVLGTR
jgi:hypothetical protein